MLVRSWELSPAEFGAPRTGLVLLLLLCRRRRMEAVTCSERGSAAQHGCDRHGQAGSWILSSGKGQLRAWKQGVKPRGLLRCYLCP